MKASAGKAAKNRKSIFIWLKNKTGKNYISVMILTAINALISVSVVLSALVLREIIDSAVAQSKSGLIKFLVIYAGIVLFQVVMRIVIRYLNERTRADIENRLKTAVYSVILSADYKSVNSFHSGELMNYLTNDTAVIADCMTEIVPSVTSLTVKLVCALVVMVTIDLKFSSIFLCAGILLFVFTLIFRKKLKEMHKIVQQKDGSVRSFLQESLDNLIVLRSFTAEPKALKTADERMKTHKDARIRKNRFANLCNAGFGFAMNFGYVLGLCWCGFGLINGSITYGTMSAVLLLINQIQRPFANMTGYLPKYYSMCASAERLMELENMPAEEKLSENSANAAGLYRDLKSIEIKNLTFSYKKTTVLENCSFTVNKGDYISFIGRSGIGKSTLLKLLIAAYTPETGEIVLNAENGKSTALSVNERCLFSYVPQGNMLLSGSVYAAVDFMHPEKTPFTQQEKDEIRKACQISCADEFISKLENGYDYIIGEHGGGLSEGQLQRLSIARALYSGAPVLLLDEATSALDEQTEAEVLANIKSLTDKTVLIVTHRRAALEVCNRNAEIVNKKIVEKDHD